MLWTFSQASWSGASPMHQEHWSICTKKCTLNSHSTSTFQTTVISELTQYVHINMCCGIWRNIHLIVYPSGIPRYPPPPHLPRPWQSRTPLGSLWGGASGRVYPATLWAAGRATPSFAAGMPVSAQHPSPATLCRGAAATVRGNETPDWQNIWQPAGEGGNGKAAGGHDECPQNKGDN